MLGSMAAIWLSIVLFGLIIVITIFSWVGRVSETTIEDHSFLYLDLSGQIKDRADDIAIADIVMDEFSAQGPTLEEILFSIKNAKEDSRIDAIFLNLGAAEMSQAMMEEIMEALKDFKLSGKKVHAYSDEMTQGDFYLASIADKVTLNPAGFIDFRGMTLTVPFFKGALDKLGVTVQILKVGTYKSAVEPFILTEMSEPNREQYTELLDSLWSDYLSTVTGNLNKRGASFSVADLDSMATSLALFKADPTTLISDHFITSSDYRRPAELSFRQNGDDYDRFETRKVFPGKYLETKRTFAVSDGRYTKNPHIALLYAVGDIVDTGEAGISGDRYVDIINRLAENDDVKALVLRVNSGGGSAFASEQIWAALENFKATGKPFYVSMGSAAASGGYYISCGADKIFADRATLTGSIGIFGLIPYARELLNDKLGITFSDVSTNANAAFPSFDRPLTPDQHQALEDHVIAGYNLFIKRVSAGRHLTTAQVDSIGQGRVWTGSKAKTIGLVDEIGGLTATLNAVSRLVSLDPRYDVVSYPNVSSTPFESIVKSLNSAKIANSVSNRAIQSISSAFNQSPAEIKKVLSILNRIRSMSTVQAKMEDIEIK